MKKRVVIAVVVGGAMGTLVPASYASAQTQVPPECVVANGPGGATVQVGYAPNGPSDCHQIA
jgi:tripartite-type tricarboxylate transporter receptor subunit TctC